MKKYVEEMPKETPDYKIRKKCEVGKNPCDKLRRTKKTHTGEK